MEEEEEEEEKEEGGGEHNIFNLSKFNCSKSLALICSKTWKPPP
jgi:hypothetical protein